MAGVWRCRGELAVLDRAMTIDENRQKKFRSLSLDRGVWYGKHIVCDFCGQETRGKIEEKQNQITLCRFVLATRELCLPPIRGVIFCHLLLLVQADIV